MKTTRIQILCVMALISSAMIDVADAATVMKVNLTRSGAPAETGFTNWETADNSTPASATVNGINLSIANIVAGTTIRSIDRGGNDSYAGSLTSLTQTWWGQRASSTGPGGSFDIEVNGLSAGDYTFTSWHVDHEDQSGGMKIILSTDGGSTWNDVVAEFSIVAGSDGAPNEKSFSFTAIDSQSVSIRFTNVTSAGSTEAFVLVNGFQIDAIPTSAIAPRVGVDFEDGSGGFSAATDDLVPYDGITVSAWTIGSGGGGANLAYDAGANSDTAYEGTYVGRMEASTTPNYFTITVDNTQTANLHSISFAYRGATGGTSSRQILLSASVGGGTTNSLYTSDPTANSLPGRDATPNWVGARTPSISLSDHAYQTLTDTTVRFVWLTAVGGLDIDAIVVSGSLGSDSTDPTMQTLSPTNGTSDVAVNTNLTITFDENVAFGTGNITLRQSGGALVESYDVTSPPAGLTLSGSTVTIDPTDDLSSSTSYYVEIDATAIDDLSGNSFAGFTGDGTWSFTTEATIIVAQFDLNSGASSTQTGFLAIGTGGGTTNGITLSFTGLDSTRTRATPSHSLADLLKDLAYDASGDGGAGTLSLSGLSANTSYAITVYSWDNNNNNGKVTTWRNGVGGPVLATTTNDTSAAPDDVDFTAEVASNGSGEITIAFSGFGFFNGMVVREIISNDPVMFVQGGDSLNPILNGSTAPTEATGTDFGVMELGATLVKTYVITNTGAQTLTLTNTPDSVTISGSSEFSVTAQPDTSSVPVDGSTSFAVTFAPTNIGIRTATVSIENNDADATPFTFEVQGVAMPSNTVAAFDLDGQSGPTQPGFHRIDMTGGTTNGITLSISGLTENRDRDLDGDLIGHRLAAVLRDMAYDDASPYQITLDLSGLTSGTEHHLTIFSYDDDFNGSQHNWYENSTGGTLLKTITPLKDTPATGFFTVTNLFSDASGNIRIVGTASDACYFNGMIISQVLQTRGSVFRFR